MNDICRNLFPDTPVGYKISYDNHLKWAGIKLFEMFDKANLIPDSFPDFPDYSYRRAYVHTNYHEYMLDPNWGNSFIPKEHQDIYHFFKDTFIDYLGIQDNCYQLKVEETLYHPLSAGLEDRFDRMANIWPRNKRQDEPIERKHLFGTGMWHTDVGCELNNMVFLMYISDVEEDMGGFVISDPPQKVGFDYTSNRPKYIGSDSPVFSDQIPYKEVTGPAGTIVGFNSHTLHRANLPKKGFRRSIHMNILSSFPEHLAEGYIPGTHEGVQLNAPTL